MTLSEFQTDFYDSRMMKTGYQKYLLTRTLEYCQGLFQLLSAAAGKLRV
jgi:hypothetical protein